MLLKCSASVLLKAATVCQPKHEMLSFSLLKVAVGLLFQIPVHFLLLSVL